MTRFIQKHHMKIISDKRKVSAVNSNGRGHGGNNKKHKGNHNGNSGGTGSGNGGGPGGYGALKLSEQVFTRQGGWHRPPPALGARTPTKVALGF